MSKFKIGCDPEFMLTDATGKLKSAIGVIEGTKDEPKQLKDGGVLYDNVNVEINTKPADSAEEFVKTLRSVLKETTKLIGEERRLLVRASADFPKEELQTREAREFGCDPDFNAYTEKVNKVPKNAAMDVFRSAGGHIHIGFTKESKDMLSCLDGKYAVIKAMDLFVGIVSVILDNDPTSMARRSLYGKAGCHRLKPYGVEYRAVGNYWLGSPKLVEAIYSLTNDAVTLCLAMKHKEALKIVGEKNLQRIINNNLKKEAKEVYDNVLKKYLSPNSIKLVDALIGKDFNFYQEWKL